MKFDVIVGNPPYNNSPDPNTPGKHMMRPIYHLFYDLAKDASHRYCLITPARFLFNEGATPTAWNKKMLSDPQLKNVYYEPTSEKVFLNTPIRGGIVVLYRSDAYSTGGGYR